MDAMGTMRDLDQIREHDDAGGSSRLMSLAMGGLATACVLFAVGVMVGRESGDGRPTTREDPLARLDQLAQQEPQAAAQITWPERLTGPAAPSAVAPSNAVVAPAVAAPSMGITAPTTAPAAQGSPVLLGSVGAPSSMTVRLSGSPLSAPSGLAASPLAAPVANGAPAAAGSEGGVLGAGELVPLDHGGAAVLCEAPRARSSRVRRTARDGPQRRRVAPRSDRSFHDAARGGDVPRAVRGPRAHADHRGAPRSGALPRAGRALTSGARQRMKSSVRPE